MAKGNSEDGNKRKAKVGKDRVEKVAQQELGHADPAVAADRLVEMAQADRLKDEAAEVRRDQAPPDFAQREQAHREQAQHEQAQREQAQHEQAQHEQAGRGQAPSGEQPGAAAEGGLVASLMAKAEARMASLPEPARTVGRLAERGLALAFWPARFGLRLAGELARTPLALVRLLLRARSA